MPTTRLAPEGHGVRPRGDALPWTRNDALVAVGAAVVDLIGFSVTSQADRGHIPAVGCVLMVVAALPLLARRRAPVLTLVAVLAAGLVLNCSVPIQQHFNATVVVALYTVVRFRGAAVVVPATLAAMAVPLVGLESWPEPRLVELVGGVASGLLVVGAAAFGNRWQRDAEAKRRRLTDRAVAEERRRIARELHDIVAHHITTMQLMAGGARANLARPEVAREALLTLEGSGRIALREMRQLLDVLRAGDETDRAEGAPDAPQPGVGDLARIVAESCRAGLPAELDVRGEERPLPPSVGLTVFRIAQEALTNARKHAGGARASVRLTYGPDGVTVEVSDDGAGPPGGFGRPAQGSGYGLVGMRERVVLHGGTLEAGPRDGGGFRVAARLPLKAGERTLG
ncbi:histidine kinase [Streptomyces eurocidicus]|uniref:Oxygen sensor histidine kinase NreB n=1 Tax=Streptomyces eurocidicus TaxID=66423 RepID=A0A2N8P3A9_STREU|nr:sensor histidine kinase [Streptomyces eurocidicus]MBB5117738.1 signal transduction histidine kinase [Streptomyces eurocidicus]MBF6053572.1 histidine kinase [Streptomyces eurocidicus]PNE35530.1 histidine kinase [Streptomyces eurocidicus]